MGGKDWEGVTPSVLLRNDNEKTKTRTQKKKVGALAGNRTLPDDL